MAFYPVSFMLPKFPDTSWISMDFDLTLSNSHGVHNDSVNSICLQYNTDTKGDLTCYSTADFLPYDLRIHVIYNPATVNPCIQT